MPDENAVTPEETNNEAPDGDLGLGKPQDSATVDSDTPEAGSSQAQSTIDEVETSTDSALQADHASPTGGLQGAPQEGTGDSGELEIKSVNESLTVEQQIEAWRDQANDICLVIHHFSNHRPKLEKLLNTVIKKINGLNERYAQDNVTEGFQILIERKPNNGQLIVEVGSLAEAYGFRDDIESKIASLVEDDKDSLIEVTSSKSVHTKTARILISTIAGYAIQSYNIYKDYASPRKLLPLDDLVLRQPNANAGPVNRSLVR